jgi:putative transposase
MKAPDALSYRKPGPQKGRTLAWQALRHPVAQHADLTQQERARYFSVSRHCIWHALRPRALTRKKTLGYQERGPLPRRPFLRRRERGCRRGKRPVYIDECGFEPCVTRRYGYALTGQRVDGLTSGKRRPRRSLIAARLDDHLQEPFLFEGSCEAVVFTVWLKTLLCPRLSGDHVVMMDNAAFHQSPAAIQRIEKTGATLLFLPPSSPALNPIENDFAALKKNRESHPTLSLDDIINAYK